jgi:hypothetical protein
MRLNKKSGNTLVVGDDEDDDYADDDLNSARGDGAAASRSPKNSAGSGGGGGSGASPNASSAADKKKATEAAVRRAIEREREWDEMKGLIESMRTGIAALGKERDETDGRLKELTAAMADEKAAKQPEMVVARDKAEVRLKELTARVAADTEELGKMETLEKSMGAAVQDYDAAAAQRSALASQLARERDTAKAAELSEKIRAIDKDRVRAPYCPSHPLRARRFLLLTFLPV